MKFGVWGGDLREYLEWVGLQGADGSKAHEPMLPETDDDAVQIMTIHGSKGLEFPITIVSGLTTQLGRFSGARGEVIWGEPGAMPQVSATSKVSTRHFDIAKELDDQMDGPERDRLLYVALTRARDHLVVSGYHSLDAKGRPRRSHGSQLYEFATDWGSHLVRAFSGQESLFSPQEYQPQASTSPVFDVPTRARWLEEHTARINNAKVRSVRSATAIAQEAPLAGSGHGWVDEETQSELEQEFEDHQLPPQVFRRGRAGTAIGSAVHAVLQFLDLVNPDDERIDSLSEAQAWSESVPEHSATIGAAVRSALQAPIVASCRSARHWKEVFVAAPVGEVTLEGYVDLLVETPAGLVVVDYKTDSVHNESDVDVKLERYSLQGAAYAVAIEVATGSQVADVQFVFTRPEGPIVRSVDNLEDRCNQVRLATTGSGSG